MLLFHQIVLGLVLVISSLASAGLSDTYDYGDESLPEITAPGDTFISQGNVQPDYLNVADFVRPAPPWWF
ncbi:hypothetical protein KR054_007602 [Drosophila jambulina]|nr:hypothetical protein KR054_007602 [Drosophila jambulina]